ncbi:hypothetical protein Tdes44962_MAKER09511 [Teratosphaeria destructans]|uniref:Uncharacterized protein n=1 Tax=Teratosphaeria destructans TaxID=418781 RepID=A0A9W7W2S6_9PEZI|nr:hypothetical protein Tdes44962_MAKER09511 [Teratosphaeria destructans]
MPGFYSGSTAVISTRTSDISANETYYVAIGRLCEKLDDHAYGYYTKGKKGFYKIAQLTLNRVMATYEWDIKRKVDRLRRAPLVANTPSGRLSRMRISSGSRPRLHYYSGSSRKYNLVVLNTDDGPGAYDSDNSTDPDIEAERVNLIDRFRVAARKPTKVTSASKTKKAATTPFKGGYTPDEVRNLSGGEAKKILMQLIAGDNAPPRKSRAPTKKAIIEISSDKQSAVPTSDDDFVRDIPRKLSEKNKRYAITILDPAQGNVSPLSKTAGMFDV